MTVSLKDVQAAAEAIKGQVERTPLRYSRTLSEITGADIWIKFENLQFTASFKERGALNKLLLLTNSEKAAGVIAMSAGNHAQGVAYHASRLGIPSTIVMPKGTPFVKIEHTRNFGARVIIHGDTLEEANNHARELEKAEGLTFVHPFDDAYVIAGQGTIGLEVLEDLADFDVVVVPVGGGGLISGIATAIKAVRPAVELIGVEPAMYPSLSAERRGEEAKVGGATIAEGIAVRDIGEIPFEMVRRRVAGILVTPERAIEEAIGLLVECAKTVAEGAGAVGLAALLAHPERFRGKKVGVAITGGNIDARILSNVLLRDLLRDGRLLRLHLQIPDRPGVLADIAGKIGNSGGNIIEVSHQRLFASSSVQAAELEVMVEARDKQHANAIVEALEQTYIVRQV